MSATEKPRVVVTRRLYPFLIDELRTAYALDDNQDDHPLAADELAQRLAGADGLLAVGGERVDDALLARTPRLKVVANVAVGYNNLDLAACTKHGVVATNTPDVLNESVADHGFALLLAAARRVGESERWLRAGLWKRWTFDMFPGADAEWAAKDDLLRQSDHVILMVPYAQSTHHLIGAAELALMKPTAVLVNLARGGVVDDKALIRALRDGRLAAAGLDVFEGEPELNPGFLELENVLMTPHIASSTRATREAMARLAMRNLAETLAGHRPPSLLNPDVWDRRRH
jgi:gluconate 2-dehydrogenase